MTAGDGDGGDDGEVTTTILLVRHAAHDHLGRILSGRMPDIPLNAAGCAQARALGRRLASTPLAAIYTSPVQRARETAAAIAEAADGHAPATADALDEIEFGAWTGRAFADLDGDPAWDAWNTRRGSAVPPGGGEAMRDVQSRLMEFAASVAARHEGGAVALVSHCDVIRAGIAGWLGLPLDHLLRFAIDPASISRVALGDGGAYVVSLNEGTA